MFVIDREYISEVFACPNLYSIHVEGIFTETKSDSKPIFELLNQRSNDDVIVSVTANQVNNNSSVMFDAADAGATTVPVTSNSTIGFEYKAFMFNGKRNLEINKNCFSQNCPESDPLSPRTADDILFKNSFFDKGMPSMCKIKVNPTKANMSIEYVGRLDPDDSLGRILTKNCPPVDSCVAEAKCKLDIFGNEFCYCPTGREGDGKKDGSGCSLMNECKTGMSDCKANSKCIDLNSGFKCECEIGFISSNPRVDDCLDVDECALNQFPIELSSCKNTIGSYLVTCNPGYQKFLNPEDQKQNCRNIDECKEGTDNCAQICQDKTPHFECSCKPGYNAVEDGGVCNEIKVEIVADEDAVAALDSSQVAEMAEKQAKMQKQAMTKMAAKMEKMTAELTANLENLSPEKAAEAAESVAASTLENLAGILMMKPKETEGQDPTLAALESSMNSRVAKENKAEQAKVMESLDNSVGLFVALAEKTLSGSSGNQSFIGTEDMAATAFDLNAALTSTDDDETVPELDLPLHKLKMHPTQSARRNARRNKRNSHDSISLVGMKANLYDFGERIDQPILRIKGMNGVQEFGFSTTLSSTVPTRVRNSFGKSSGKSSENPSIRQNQKRSG